MLCGLHASEIVDAPTSPLKAEIEKARWPSRRRAVTGLMSTYPMRPGTVGLFDAKYRLSSCTISDTPYEMVCRTPLYAMLLPNRWPQAPAPCPHSHGMFRAWLMPALVASPRMAHGPIVLNT